MCHIRRFEKERFTDIVALLVLGYTKVSLNFARVFAEALLKTFHKVKQVLHRILLLANWTLLTRLVDHVIKDSAWIDIELIRVEQLNEEELKFMCHLLTDCDPSILCFLIRIGVAGSSLPVDDSLEKFIAHVGQKEEGLYERIEVAGVSNVFKTYWHLYFSLSFVERKRLCLQTCLNRSLDLLFTCLRPKLLSSCTHLLAMTSCCGLVLLTRDLLLLLVCSWFNQIRDRFAWHLRRICLPLLLLILLLDGLLLGRWLRSLLTQIVRGVLLVVVLVLQCLSDLLFSEGQADGANILHHNINLILRYLVAHVAIL